MACDARPFLTATLLTAALGAGCAASVGAAAAQTRVVVSSILYESSTVVAPIVVYVDADARREWRAGVAGWTLSAETTRPGREGISWQAGAELTPINAHSSNRIYAAGEVVDSLAFDNGAARAWLGMRRQHSPSWSSALRGSILQERVGGLPDATEAFWELPYFGIEWSERWSRASSVDPISRTWRGATASLLVNAYAGRRGWARASAAVGAAGTVGPFRMRSTLNAFAGSNLNLVSRFLVGGSWDLPGMLPLYGYPYAAFRLDQGLLFDAGADLPVAGRFDIGLRGATLLCRGTPRAGVALRLATVVSGVGMSLQLAVPDAAVGSDADWPLMLVAETTAAFFTR